MTDKEVWQLLERGGFRTEGPSGHQGKNETRALLTKYDALRDPAGTERLGVLLADQARGANVNVVVVWDDAQDTLLGFIVGRELGMPVVQVGDSEGLLEARGPFPENPKAVFVADAIASVGMLVALNSLLAQSGGELASVVTIVGFESQGLPVEHSSLVAVEPSDESEAADARG